MSKPYRFVTLLVLDRAPCEGYADGDLMEYDCTVGSEGPEIDSPDDQQTAYHFDEGEWAELVAKLEAGVSVKLHEGGLLPEGWVIGWHE